jgi:hypothetical protein
LQTSAFSEEVVRTGIEVCEQGVAAFRKVDEAVVGALL